jgi:HEAT repeats
VRKLHTWTKAAAAILVVVIVAVGFAITRGRNRTHVGGTMPADIDDRDSRWRGFAAEVPGIPSRPAQAPADTPVAPGGPGSPLPSAAGEAPPPNRNDEATMDRWRRAILERRTEEILDLDQDFALEPAHYGPLLELSAGNDPDDRVRAFSTRVLGKYKNVAAANVFDRLLADRSEFVRQNAAWALGELAERPSGREAANRSAGQLRQLQESDASPDVRKAAADALKKL